jgi:glycosyltransferase involved in cell wall biosynthesis
MKILSITAGAAGMYCGSCFRDNAVAAELIAEGHQVILMPVYTPTRTDEPNVSERRVLFGGISVYLQQRLPLFRALPRFIDHLWDAPAVLEKVATRGVATSPELLGELTIATLEGREGVLAREFNKLVEWARHEPPPDVLNLPNTLLIAMAAPLRAAFKRPICCSVQGEELFIEGLAPRYRGRALDLIKRQVGQVDRFIAVSDYSAGFISKYLDIPRERISVARLGVPFDGYLPRSPDPSCFTVGYFARIAPEKGLHLLADAYILLRRQMGNAPARLEVAGYMGQAQRRYLEQVERVLTDAGLGGELTYRGEVDRAGKIDFLRRLDVLSVPATYDEPKGMFLLEAMACGVPVVEPRRGAFTEIVDRTGGGLLVAPDNPEALAAGVLQLFRDRALGDRLGAAAFDGVRQHHTIAESARQTLAAYDLALSGAPPSGD